MLPTKDFRGPSATLIPCEGGEVRPLSVKELVRAQGVPTNLWPPARRGLLGSGGKRGSSAVTEVWLTKRNLDRDTQLGGGPGNRKNPTGVELVRCYWEKRGTSFSLTQGQKGGPWLDQVGQEAVLSKLADFSRKSYNA